MRRMSFIYSFSYLLASRVLSSLLHCKSTRIGQILQFFLRVSFYFICSLWKLTWWADECVYITYGSMDRGKIAIFLSSFPYVHECIMNIYSQKSTSDWWEHDYSTKHDESNYKPLTILCHQAQSGSLSPNSEGEMTHLIICMATIFYYNCPTTNNVRIIAPVEQSRMKCYLSEGNLMSEHFKLLTSTFPHTTPYYGGTFMGECGVSHGKTTCFHGTHQEFPARIMMTRKIIIHNLPRGNYY